MAVSCPVTGCDIPEKIGVTEVIGHFEEFHGTKKILMENAKMELNIELADAKDTKTDCLTVPFVIEYDGIHFLFIVNCVDERYFFWMYFVEDGVPSDGRQFKGKFFIVSQTKSHVGNKEADWNVIYPISTPIENIMTDRRRPLMIHDKGLRKNFLTQEKHYVIQFSVEELERIIIVPEPEPEPEPLPEVEEEPPLEDEIEEKQELIMAGEKEELEKISVPDEEEDCVEKIEDLNLGPEEEDEIIPQGPAVFFTFNCPNCNVDIAEFKTKCTLNIRAVPSQQKFAKAKKPAARKDCHK